MKQMQDEHFMSRCFHLAKRAANQVKSNPNVGALLTYHGRIIGEGYHEFFGGPHAERNAIESVSEKDRSLIPKSCLYVSLEPCNHVGKTAACTQLIMNHGVKSLKVSTLDPDERMSGKSIQFLENAGINITTGILQELGKELIRPFECVTRLKRPYIILKFAQSMDGFLGKKGKQIWMSGADTQILNHQWRTEIDAILVGVNTVLSDNPSLTARHFPGSSPLRVVIDPNARIPKNAKIIQDEFESLIFTTKELPFPIKANKKIVVLNDALPIIDQLLKYLFENGIFRVLVEGGGNTLERFLKSNLWDEARIIKTEVELHDGIKAPPVMGRLSNIRSMRQDEIVYIANNIQY